MPEEDCTGLLLGPHRTVEILGFAHLGILQGLALTFAVRYSMGYVCAVSKGELGKLESRFGFRT